MGDLLGTQVGNIRIVDTLASGGMGDVYIGFDVKLNRKVAVKSIRKDHRMDDEAKARFLREARTLSKLDHPNICRIHEYIDGEESDLLVLELIDGVSLGRASREGMKKGVALRVVEQVAQVLEAAHAANVVHRDLKPENVMLTTDGEVKVLDFGISRSLDEEHAATRKMTPERPEAAPVPDDAESTMVVGDSPVTAGSSGPGPYDSEEVHLHTTAGSILGTVAYMSPEQAQGELVTAASDMYSFGLLVQEIFMGAPPVDPELPALEQLAIAAKGESTAASGFDKDLVALVDRLKSVAPSARPTAAETVARLKWIAAKPGRRLRRMAAAAVILMVIGSAAKYTFDLRRERNAAVEARAAEELAKEEALVIVKFLVGLFEVANPGETRGNTVTARELLDRGAKKVADELEDQPRVRARLGETMGAVYRKLGLYEQAAPLLEEALSLNEQQYAANDALIADSLDRLANLYLEQRRWDEAEPLYRRAVEIYEQDPDCGPDHPKVAGRLNNLAIICQHQRRYDEAEPLLERCLHIKEKAFGLDAEEVASSLNNLANLYRRLERYDDAEYLYRRALRIRERSLGKDHPDVALVLSNLAIICTRSERPGEAEDLYRRALAIKEKTLGPDHPEVGRSANNLASMFIDNRRFADAEPLLERALGIFEKIHGPEHIDVAVGLYNLGEVYRELERLDEAETVYRRCLALFEATQGNDSALVAYPVLGLANVEAEMSRFGRAEPLFKRALSIREARLKDGDADLETTRSDYAAMLRRAGRVAEAEALEAKNGSLP